MTSDWREINEKIQSAWTIGSSFYTDPDLFATSASRIFARSWQWVTDVGSVKVPGQTYPFTLLEGLLDEPLLFTRDFEDRVHLLSNVCTHRGNIVVEAGGNERSLRCRYHGRKFALDGQFQSMPEFEGVEGFPSACDDLPRVPFGAWKNLLFAACDPDVSFDEFIAPMEDRVGWLPLEKAAFDSGRARDYLVKGHWALYVDNYLEGFHIPYIHAELAQTLDYGSYRTEIFRGGNVQIGAAKGGEHAFQIPESSSDYGQSIAAYYFWFFPNLMFNYYPWGCSINVLRPLATNLTKVSFIPYVWDETKLELGAGAALDRVEREDEAVVELVQKGVKSRFYDRGRYSPEREKGVHQFHQLIARAMAEPT